MNDDRAKPIVFLIGPPFAGKSTIGQDLLWTLQHKSVLTGASMISTGDIARSMAEEDPETKAALASGRPAPPHRFDSLALQAILSMDSTEYGIVDGYPRYMDQFVDICLVRLTRPIAFLEVRVLKSTAWARAEKRGREYDVLTFGKRWDYWSRVTEPLARAIEGSYPALYFTIDGEDPCSRKGVGDWLESLSW